MNDTIPPFLINPKTRFVEPGTVAFIPGWIMLFITILSFALLFPGFFKDKKTKGSPISPTFLAFIVGSLMPAFDDLFAFVFGPPFAHHSLFHSLAGAGLIYLIFRVISTKNLAKYAFWGNTTHIVFNFYLDFTTLLFPLTYQEFGLSGLTGISTYWLKAIHYPLILFFFIYSVVKYFWSQK